VSSSVHDPRSAIDATTLPRLGRCHAPDGGSERGSDPRQIFGQHVSNVAVITTCQRGTPVGVLVSSLASISTEPPVISFSISATSWAWSALEQADHIGVHLLASGQEELATRFSPDQTAGGFQAALPWRPGPHGVPLLDGCLAWTVAQPKQLIHTGNHVIIVSHLLAGQARDDAAPLLTRAGSHRLAS
jgi:flavin reductase (DIM6/NTAB) family NADH-FMN oxidoreductase RutF